MHIDLNKDKTDIIGSELLHCDNTFKENEYLGYRNKSIRSHSKDRICKETPNEKQITLLKLNHK